MENIGLSVNAPIKFAKWWSSTIYTNIYRNRYSGTFISLESGQPKAERIDLSYNSFTVNFTNTLTLAKGWTGEITAWYRHKALQDLNIAEPMGQLSFGLAKNNLLKGKGSIRLNARDPFGWQQYKGTTRYSSIDVQITNRWDSRSYGASFTYRFGKQANQLVRRRNASQDEQNRVGVGG